MSRRCARTRAAGPRGASSPLPVLTGRGWGWGWGWGSLAGGGWPFRLPETSPAPPLAPPRKRRGGESPTPLLPSPFLRGGVAGGALWPAAATDGLSGFRKPRPPHLWPLPARGGEGNCRRIFSPPVLTGRGIAGSRDLPRRL